MIDALFAEDYSTRLDLDLIDVDERKWYNFLYSRLHPKKVIQLFFSFSFTFLTSIFDWLPETFIIKTSKMLRIKGDSNLSSPIKLTR